MTDLTVKIVVTGHDRISAAFKQWDDTVAQAGVAMEQCIEALDGFSRSYHGYVECAAEAEAAITEAYLRQLVGMCNGTGFDVQDWERKCEWIALEMGASYWYPRMAVVLTALIVLASLIAR